MCFSNPGIKFEPALQGYDNKIEHLSSYRSRRPHNCKTGHLARTSTKFPKMNNAHAKSAKLLFFNMQIYNVLVAVVVVVA